MALRSGRNVSPMAVSHRSLSASARNWSTCSPVASFATLRRTSWLAPGGALLLHGRPLGRGWFDREGCGDLRGLRGAGRAVLEAVGVDPGLERLRLDPIRDAKAVSRRFDCRLPEAKAISVLAHLQEGIGIRKTSRLTGVNKNTVVRLALVAGRHAQHLHDEFVAFSPSDP